MSTQLDEPDLRLLLHQSADRAAEHLAAPSLTGIREAGHRVLRRRRIQQWTGGVGGVLALAAAATLVPGHGTTSVAGQPHPASTTDVTSRITSVTTLNASQTYTVSVSQGPGQQISVIAYGPGSEPVFVAPSTAVIAIQDDTPMLTTVDGSLAPGAIARIGDQAVVVLVPAGATNVTVLPVAPATSLPHSVQSRLTLLPGTGYAAVAFTFQTPLASGQELTVQWSRPDGQTHTS